MTDGRRSDLERTAGERDRAAEAAPATAGADAAIPEQEEQWFGRVRQSLAATPTARIGGGGGQNGGKRAGASRRFDEELVALRDEIGEARLEDVPALVAQMERLQEISLTRAELQTVLIDPQSPYFGHLRLREAVPGRGVIERDVFIGRATFNDPKARVHIVDWRNAPISQLYYRYSEGSDYEETFGEREVEGEILVRRTLTIQEGALLRVASPQGVWTKRFGVGSPRPATSDAGEAAGRGRRAGTRRGRERDLAPHGGPDVRARRGAGEGDPPDPPSARVPRRRPRGAAAPGSAPARDRRAHRSAPVRDHDRAALGRHRHPGRRRERQDDDRAPSPRLPGVRLPRSLPCPSHAGGDPRDGAGGVHGRGVTRARRLGRPGVDVPGVGPRRSCARPSPGSPRR